jgi:NAD(P)-dependent dehydrogenase (short-subunit alcohol dehydrogenase family)/rhamnose utilization protein RhaD (predicted bifunctional aldolase and dehydrogenase)
MNASAGAAAGMNASAGAAAGVDLGPLIEISRFYGEGNDFVIAGGGNTSVKDDERLVIKASGVGLRGITDAGFVALSRASVRRILAGSYSEDPFEREAQVKTALMASRIDTERGGRPSVESPLHELIGWRYVVHTHTWMANALTCGRGGEKAARELFGDEALWVPYTDPGYRLAKLMEEMLAAYRCVHGADPRIVLMQNHGLVVGADSTGEVKQITDRVVARITERFEGPLPAAERSVPPGAADVIPALRMLLSTAETTKCVVVRNSELIEHFLAPANRGGVQLPFMPDNIVYCKSAPLVLEHGKDPGRLLNSVPAALKAYTARWGYPPKVVLIEGIGAAAVEDSRRSAETCLDVFEDLMRVSFQSRAFGGPRFLSARDIEFIDTWEVESYRRAVAKAGSARGRMDGRIALVTGAAQGFGRGIAEGLFREGANVVLADLNDAAGRELAAALDARAAGAGASNRSVFVHADVTNPSSLESLALECVKAFGGLDLLVSNAGVLRAGGLDEMSLESFEFVTRVNYTGYFLCVKHLSPIMKLQHRFRPGRYADIVQINSKSGLEGSNRNFAYAGGKFGGIGLTQSFALELLEHGIKVNAVCPGNYFEGPLWSDPEKGLFVQYLRAGKVPGARTVDDVRRHYESRVPMGRGCRVEDVVRAILYIVEQEYETGQAVPVTGGQVMLG